MNLINNITHRRMISIVASTTGCAITNPLALAPQASLTDAFSTAFSAMKIQDIKTALQRFTKTSAIIVNNDDAVVTL